MILKENVEKFFNLVHKNNLRDCFKILTNFYKKNRFENSEFKKESFNIKKIEQENTKNIFVNTLFNFHSKFFSSLSKILLSLDELMISKGHQVKVK